MNIYLDAMKQALEALEKSRSYIDLVHSESKINLRTAIEQMEKAEPFGYLHINDRRMPIFHFHKSSHADRIPVYTHPAIPEGFTLVPKEPTEKMQEAMLKANIYPPKQPDGSVSIRAQNLHIYKAMLQAAPKSGEVK